MTFFRTLTSFSLFLLLTSSAFAGVASDQSGVLGYQAWKNSRIEEAKATVEHVQAETQAALASGKQPDAKIVKGPQEIRPTPKSSRADQRLQQAQLNLEIAQELAVNDYFVLYLNQLKTRDSFVEAAKKLTPDEMADLMVSYQKYLAGISQQDSAPTPVSGLGLGTKPARAGL